jgi:site-specific DNA recombinase
MSELQAALYARVSSEQQTQAQTIASQLAAVRERIAADGLSLPAERQFIDDGYSGATLVRPALERLRDLAAAGGVDRLYLHSPDRLARKYAYQVLLVDEFRRAGVELVFLNRALGQTPEDDLLLQVQGMVAEYERAKILERSRRGKRHAAQSGDVSVLSGAPYGYRYVPKADGGGQARYEIVLEEARVVRQVFTWVGQERLSINAVCRRLQEAGERTRSGKMYWDRTTVWDMLKNPAYQGEAAFGKTRIGPMQPRLRAQRGKPLQPRRAKSVTDVAQDAWIRVPVPALVSRELFAVVQEQLDENRRRARLGQRNARYLLQGLVCCAECGYAFYGKPVSPATRKGNPRSYAYYRCIGSDAYRFGGQRLCHNPQVRTDLLDSTVWQQVRGVLTDPERLAAEYERRLRAPEQPERQQELTGVEQQVRKLKQGMGRLIDSYAEGLIEKADFEPRLLRLRARVVVLEAQARDLAVAAAEQEELRLVIGQVRDFAATVAERLDQPDWAAQRELIRTLVKRVEIDQQHVTVVFRIGSGLIGADPDPTIMQSRRRREYPALRGALLGRKQPLTIQHARFEPGPNGPAEGGGGVELGKKGRLVDAIERSGTTLPTSMVFRLQSPWSGQTIRCKATPSLCSAGCSAKGRLISS